MSGAEIVSVVEHVVSTGYRIYTVYCSLRDAPAEVRQFCDELQSLRGVLSDIGVSASKHHDVVSAGGRAIGPDSILISLKGCESELNTIWLDVSQLQSNRGLEWRQALQKLTKSVRWMLKTEEIEKATKRLERLKQSLVLSMVLCGLQVTKNRARLELPLTANSQEYRHDGSGELGFHRISSGREQQRRRGPHAAA